MAAYLDKAFGTEKLRGELENRDSAFYFLYCGGTLAGYLKLNELRPKRIFTTPIPWRSSGSMWQRNFREKVWGVA